MPVTTIDTLRAEFAQLAKKLEAFERQPQFPITLTAPSLNEGEKYVGTILSADGTRHEHLILLPNTFTGNHADAMKWAESIGGELPDRVEGALLFAMKQSGLLEGEFEESWYWTREIHASDSDYAWLQGFGDGGQGYNYAYTRGRARAVRRLSI